MPDHESEAGLVGGLAVELQLEAVDQESLQHFEELRLGCMLAVGRLGLDVVAVASASDPVRSAGVFGIDPMTETSNASVPGARFTAAVSKDRGWELAVMGIKSARKTGGIPTERRLSRDQSLFECAKLPMHSRQERSEVFFSTLLPELLVGVVSVA